ncbi:MAG: DUF3383 family protein [Porphyromonas sp.]|nr:DUF3383 family protein [Porphyromonas sp.]
MIYLAYKLDLSPIVDVVINLSAKAAARKGFNLGLIIGKSTVISKAERVRIYTNASQMLEDGFKNTSPEYKAALLYFSASTKPRKLAVGVKATEDENLTATLEACRSANSQWWAFSYLGAEDVDIKDCAAWAESAVPDSVYMYTTADKSVLDTIGDEMSIFKALKDENYRRSFGQYCGDAETPDAVVATMGYAMGANRGLASDAFTLAYKTLPGVKVDDLSESQVTHVCGSAESTGHNGNVYINRGEEYDILQQGYMADGTSYDEILYLDMLKNEITLNVMDLLYQRRKIPQTESGVTSIINVINDACRKYVKLGFIAPGKWNGAECLELQTGDYLPDGYLVQSDPIDEQLQADRDKRKAPPIYVCCKLAGAIEFIAIQVNVNR